MHSKTRVCALQPETNEVYSWISNAARLVAIELDRTWHILQHFKRARLPLSIVFSCGEGDGVAHCFLQFFCSTSARHQGPSVWWVTDSRRRPPWRSDALGDAFMCHQTERVREKGATGEWWVMMNGRINEGYITEWCYFPHCGMYGSHHSVCYGYIFHLRIGIFTYQYIQITLNVSRCLDNVCF